MTHRSTHAADTRAAQAALTGHPYENADRYLLIDDSDEDITQFITVLRKRSERGQDGLS